MLTKIPFNLSSVTVSLALTTLISTPVFANSLEKALSQGKVYGNFNLRYENVAQDNSKKDADALTLRSRLGYNTAWLNGFAAGIEFEDSRVVAGVDDYNNTNGKHTAYSTIADPETTEIDQLFIRFKNKMFGAKVGRQVLTHDNHRFVGHVGWRQDRQTFDAATFKFKPTKNIKLKYSYVDQRNRIFAEEKDIESEDHLLNASFKTKLGKLTGYGYLLEVDNNTDNSLDTWGIRFAGATKVSKTKVMYQLEFASQEMDSGSSDFDADYILVEGGAVFGPVTAKLGYEMLGSDDGMYGFSTPLATLHKFNGWSDQFLSTPAQGLTDLYLSLSGKLMKGKWMVVYHDFEADEDTAAVDDLGDEINLSYSRAFGKHYFAGIKFAAYSDGDVAAGKVNTDKFWLWAGAKF